MTAALTAIIALIEQLLPAILSASEATLVDKILAVLVNLLPFIVQEAQALYQPVKNIIAALSASPAATAEQLATLQALDLKLDAAFEGVAAQTDADAAAPPSS